MHKVGSEHFSAGVVLFLAIAGGLLYFAGAQFADAKASAFGLAGDPGDVGFQKTTARGAAVFLHGQALRYLAAIVTIVWIAIRVVDYLVDIRRLKKRAAELRRRYEPLAVTTNKIRERLETDTSAAVRSMEFIFLLLSTSVAVFVLKYRVLFLDWMVSARDTALSIAAATVFIGAALCLILVIEAGGSEGRRTAIEIRSAVAGMCPACRTYSVGQRSVRGVAVTQSATNIYVAERGGLAVVPLTADLRISDAANKAGRTDPALTRLP